MSGNPVVIQAESGANHERSVHGKEEIGFIVFDAETTRVVGLDGTQNSLEISGKVPNPDDYVFLVHYFQPVEPQLKVGASLLPDDADESKYIDGMQRDLFRIKAHFQVV